MVFLAMESIRPRAVIVIIVEEVLFIGYSWTTFIVLVISLRENKHIVKRNYTGNLCNDHPILMLNVYVSLIVVSYIRCNFSFVISIYFLTIVLRQNVTKIEDDWLYNFENHFIYTCINMLYVHYVEHIYIPIAVNWKCAMRV